MQLGQAHPQRFDDAPPAEICAKSDCREASNDDPGGRIDGIRSCRRGQSVGRDEEGGDDAHSLLGIVHSVAETENGGRDQLPSAEYVIYLARRGVAEEPVHQQHHPTAKNQPDQRRDHDVGDHFEEAFRFERNQSGLGHGRPAKTAYQGMR